MRFGCLVAVLSGTGCSGSCGAKSETGATDTGIASSHQGDGRAADRLSDIVQIDAEHRLACALDSEGRIYCWGQFDFDPNYAELDRDYSRPVLLRGVDRARSMAIHPSSPNFWVGYVLENSGEVKAWGNDVGPVYRVERSGDPPQRIVEPYDPTLDATLAEREFPGEVLAPSNPPEKGDLVWEPSREPSRDPLTRGGTFVWQRSRLQRRFTRRAVTTRVTTRGELVYSEVCPVGELAEHVRLGDDRGSGSHCVFTTDEPTWQAIQRGEPDLELEGCALIAGGEARCWVQCERGDPNETDRRTRSSGLGLPANAVDLVFVDFHRCWAARLADGKVATWCDNVLENEDSTGYRCTEWIGPMLEPDLEDIVAIDEGLAPGLCALARDGDVLCLTPSADRFASERTRREHRHRYSGFQDPVAMAAGMGFVCVLTAQGNVQCAGRNDYGQCGTGAPVLGYDRRSERIEEPSFVVAPGSDQDDHPTAGDP